jgi:hypothetical protein
MITFTAVKLLTYITVIITKSIPSVVKIFLHLTNHNTSKAISRITKHHAIRFYWRNGLYGSEWSASRHGRFSPGVRAPSTHWIGAWMCPRSGLDEVAKKDPIIAPVGNRTPIVQPIA